MSNPVETGNLDLVINAQTGQAEVGLRKIGAGLDGIGNSAKKAHHEAGILDHKLQHIIGHHIKSLTGGIVATAGLGGLAFTAAFTGMEKLFEGYSERLQEFKKEQLEAIQEIGKAQETVGKTKGVSSAEVEKFKKAGVNGTTEDIAKVFSEIKSQHAGGSFADNASLISEVLANEPTAEGAGALGGGLLSLGIKGSLTGLIEESGNRAGEVAEYIKKNRKRLSKSPNAAGEIAAYARALNSQDPQQAERTARAHPDADLASELVGKVPEGNEIAKANRSLKVAAEGRSEYLDEAENLSEKKLIEASLFSSKAFTDIANPANFTQKDFEGIASTYPNLNDLPFNVASSVRDKSDDQRNMAPVLAEVGRVMREIHASMTRRNQEYTDARNDARPKE